jgi:hypothetical protein
MHHIARQSVLASEGDNVTALDPAEATIRRRPQCAARIEPKTADLAVTQPVSCSIGGMDLVIFEIGNSAVEKS